MEPSLHHSLLVIDSITSPIPLPRRKRLGGGGTESLNLLITRLGPLLISPSSQVLFQKQFMIEKETHLILSNLWNLKGFRNCVPEMEMKTKYICLIMNQNITMALPTFKLQRPSHTWETVTAKSPVCLSLGLSCQGSSLGPPPYTLYFVVSPQDLEAMGCKSRHGGQAWTLPQG